MGEVWGTIPANMAKRKGRKTGARKPRRSARKARGAAGGKLPKDAVTLTVILRAREGQETLLEAELRALVGPSRREEGCLAYNLHRSIDTPRALLLHHVWASPEPHTQHSHTPHFLRWHAPT